ncbi:hypothetical protein HDU97_007185 [Phlyctochytrium planicorne]|nr:hypothetical protein HDU97_007185 [Phlyctochytrium planicorne]
MSVPVLLSVALVKAAVSGALCGWLNHGGENKELVVGVDVLREVKGMAVLGALYAFLSVLSQNPYSATSLSNPSLNNLVSFMIPPMILVYWKFEKLDHLRWMSLFIVGGAFSNLVGLGCRKVVGIGGVGGGVIGCVGRVWHGIEIKKGKKTSLHLKNFVLSFGTLLMLAIIYICGDLIRAKDSSSTRTKMPSVSALLPVVMLQAIVELVATSVYRYSNVIVSELAIVITTFLSTLLTTREKPNDIFSLKVICSVIACLAIVQYLLAANVVVSPPPIWEQKDRDRKLSAGLFDLLEDDDETTPTKKKCNLVGWKIWALGVVVVAMMGWGFLERHAVGGDVNPLVRVEVDEELVYPVLDRFQENGLGRWKLELDHADSFYDVGLGVVIPSWGGHIGYLENLFKSFEKYCLDCDKVRFLVIPSQGEEPVFESLKLRYNFLKRLEIRSFADVYPDLRNPAINMTQQEFYDQKGKYTFQSMKKLMGCLHMNATYCWMLDSESFMFQSTSIRTLVRNYFLNPHVVYASHDRSATYQTIVAKDVLGYKEHIGWVMEEYLWFMETDILRTIRHILDVKNPTVKDMMENFFIEVVYYVYLLHNRQDFWQYRILDSANVLGPYYGVRIKAWHDIGISSIEDVRQLFEEYPETVEVFAERYATYGLRFFKSVGEFGSVESSVKFLDVAHSVTMCVSDQDETLFALAMEGRWANRTIGFPKRKVMDYCVNHESVC